MITPLFAYVAFFVFACVVRTRTFIILFIASWINLFVDQFTTEHTEFLMLLYASIDFLTALAILCLGDTRQVYQSLCLFAMVVCHYMLEWDLLFDTSIIYENYESVVSFLILMQLVGASCGINRHKVFNRFSSDIHKIDCTALFNRSTN